MSLVKKDGQRFMSMGQLIDEMDTVVMTGNYDLLKMLIEHIEAKKEYNYQKLFMTSILQKIDARDL
jgi:hypothetical protein